ncbi:HsdM family class I SAM-dependent methyltransferase [Gaoshiqia sediminis]|uniref:SAM-dependent methyltransferase n=1 Tax=Gaoshiqia sediminis TaxID=2986998 RepID=A0AA41YAD6_9BACT|nr:N-6 DNA methylase [Gaoshiqia sediminis]MCW0482408.1 SAM-dependent methyltransferase [Gaoshiqia sediminis]
MGNNFFIQELEFRNLTEQLPEDIAGKIEGITGVHYSGKLPAVFIKEVENFEIPVLKEIAKLQKQIWNNSTVVFLYVVSPAEIRIYNCNDKPRPHKDDNELEPMLNEKLVESCTIDDKKKLEQIKHVFSAAGIDCGAVWTSEEGYAKKIKLQTKVDSFLVDSLIGLAKKLNDEIKNEEVIHSLLMRSIFIMYLQDRGAIPQSIWDEVGEHDFLKILNDHEKTYQLFGKISSNFNGNAFPLVDCEKDIVSPVHLKYLKNCLIDGDINLDQSKLFDGWRLFNFSLIRIEMLSEIYENFLGEFNPEGKRNAGAYYTPPALVELVLNNVLPDHETDFDKKILDPACGSGIFLAMAYKRLVNRWKKSTNREPDFKVLSDLLTDHIFGVELDKKSIKVAAFSLYLSMLDFLDPRDIWLDNDKQFPYLIYDEESPNQDDKKGSNLFRADTIAEGGKFENISYDLVIGNPPFGTDGLKENIKGYCNRHKFAQQFVIPFIHKSASLARNGKVALLFNTQLLTYPNTGLVAFRKWLFCNNYVEKIFNLAIFRNATKDFGGSLFSTAKVPVSIAIFRPSQPEKRSRTIEYWAPKTFIRNSVVEGVIIDTTDIKYLPREECENPESKIWKIAQWGNLPDYFLINKLTQNNLSIQELEKDNLISIKAGLHAAEKGKERIRINGLFLETKKIQHYYTSNRYVKNIDAEFRKIDTTIFSPPYIGIPQNIMKRKICVSYFDKTVFFKSGIFCLNSENNNLLKNLTILFNSKLSNYYFFLISGCWGIERDQLYLSTEYKTFPVSDEFIKKQNELDFQKTNFILDELDFDNKPETFNVARYDEEIYSSYNLQQKEIAMIEDFVKYSISLFYDKENSIALRPIASETPETLSYAEMLCNEINDFLMVGELKVNARVYSVSPYTPLCIVVLEIVAKEKVASPRLVDADAEFQKDLKEIEKYTWTRYAENIYVRKQVRFVTDDSIFIAKPNQKRFWTRSQAIEDAQSIINELSAAEYADQ